MASKTTKRVSVHIPRVSVKEEQNLFVCINGENFIIPKGQTVEVPDYVAAEIERSQAAKDDMYASAETLQEQSKQSASAAGV